MTKRKIFAYLRVSTNQQDVDNQKQGIKRYIVNRDFSNVEYVFDDVSGRVWWNKRKLGESKSGATKRRE